jgi:hypothetical protein
MAFQARTSAEHRPTGEETEVARPLGRRPSVRQRPVAELAFSEPSGPPAWKSSPAWAEKPPPTATTCGPRELPRRCPRRGLRIPRRCGPGHPARLRRPPRLALNHWALADSWTVGRQAIMANQAGGRILYRFHARDLHLVMAPPTPETPARFQVLVDQPPPAPTSTTRATAPSPTHGCTSSSANPAPSATTPWSSASSIPPSRPTPSPSASPAMPASPGTHRRDWDRERRVARVPGGGDWPTPSCPGPLPGP